MSTTPSLPAIQPVSANPHFARIGGEAGIARLVEAFYRHMDTRPDASVIRAMHDADLGHTKAVLRLYLCEWMGGPKDYTAQRGRPALRRRHQPFAIGQAEQDAWLQCMRAALDETVGDTGLREELMAAFTRTAQAVRNDQPRSHPLVL